MCSIKLKRKMKQMFKIGEWAVFNDGKTVFGDDIPSYIYGKVIGYARRADDGKVCGYLIEGYGAIMRVKATEMNNPMPCPEPLKQWIGKEVNIKVMCCNEPVYTKGIVKAVGYDGAGVCDLLFIDDGCNSQMVPAISLNDATMRDVHEPVDEHSNGDMTQKDPVIVDFEIGIIRERNLRKLKDICKEKGINCGLL